MGGDAITWHKEVLPFLHMWRVTSGRKLAIISSTRLITHTRGVSCKKPITVLLVQISSGISSVVCLQTLINTQRCVGDIGRDKKKLRK